MTQFNRRNWLKWAAATSAGTILAPNLVFHEYYPSNIQKSTAEIIRLYANENPYAPSEKVREALIDGFSEASRYPHQRYKELVSILAEHEGLSPDHIVVTGGSTEGLKAVGLAMGLQGGEIIAARPTFLALLDYAAQFGATINWVPVNDQLEHDLDEMEKRVSERTKMIFICNPNNPTGTVIPSDRLADFCESMASKVIVFSDEAYYDYIEIPDYPSMVSLVKKGLDVIVSRTFSKVYGLAGLRIGYLIARPDIARGIKDNLMAFTNMLAIYAAKQALHDEAFYRYSLMKNREAKSYVYALLDGMGKRYIRSHTNFVFFHTGKPIESLIQEVLHEGIRIGRPFPPYLDWCRISTGTMEEMEKFGTAMKKWL